MARPKKIVKQMLTKIVKNIPCYDLDGSIDYAVKILTETQQKYPGARLDYGQHDAYSESYSFNVLIEVEETDAEYEARIAKAVLEKETQTQWLQKHAERMGYELVKKPRGKKAA